MDEDLRKIMFHSSSSSWIPATPLKSNHESSINLLDQGFSGETSGGVVVPGILLHNYNFDATTTFLTPVKDTQQQHYSELFSVPDLNCNFLSPNVQSGTSSIQVNLKIVQDFTLPPPATPCSVGIKVSVTDHQTPANQTNECDATVPVVDDDTLEKSGNGGEGIEKRRRKEKPPKQKLKKPKRKVHRPKILDLNKKQTSKTAEPKTPKQPGVNRKRTTPATKIASEKRKSAKKRKKIETPSFPVSTPPHEIQASATDDDEQSESKSKSKSKSSKRVLNFDLNASPPSNSVSFDIQCDQEPEPINVVPAEQFCSITRQTESTNPPFIAADDHGSTNPPLIAADDHVNTSIERLQLPTPVKKDLGRIITDENDCGHRPATWVRGRERVSKRSGLRSPQCLACDNLSLLGPTLKNCKRLRTVKYKMSKSVAKALERLNFAKKWMLLPNKLKTRTLLRNLEQFKCALALCTDSLHGVKKMRRRVRVDPSFLPDEVPGPSSQADEVPGPSSQPNEVSLVMVDEVTVEDTDCKKKSMKAAKKSSKEKAAKKPPKEKVPMKRGKKKWKTPPKLTGRNGVTLDEMMEYLTETLNSLYITPSAIVLYEETKMEVNFNADTKPVCYLLKDKPEGYDPLHEAEEEQRKWMEEERRKFDKKVYMFTSIAQAFLGDRSFSPWKGSIVDSVVGVYLTQNVGDHLSSSAFMSIASAFPLRSSIRTLKGCEENFTMNEENFTMNEEPSSEQSEKMTKSNDDLPYQDANIAPLSSQADGVAHLTIKELEGASFQSTDKKKTSKKNQKTKGEKKEGDTATNWDHLRRSYSKLMKGLERSPETMDSVDWEAVRKADVKKISDSIAIRGQQNILAQSIKNFLDRMVKDHGSIDLEWLRDVPPETTKEYLLSINGIGMKSVECLRLLSLQHHAFPVDTNVARIVVRLGWVPLQPLPEEVEIHLLNNFPQMEKIQAYLWPRLCHLDQPTLYRLHYLMITFGKVFCVKSKPNCGPCPLKAQCRFYASAWASSRRALTGAPDKRMVNRKASKKAVENPFDFKHVLALPFADLYSKTKSQEQNCEPIVEMPLSPEPQLEHIPDIEDYLSDDPDAIPVLDLSSHAFHENVEKYLDEWELSLQDGDGVPSSALVSIPSYPTYMPPPKWKQSVRLRTEHQVFELPDSHPLLYGLDRREDGDPCPYLLAIWTKDSCKCEGQEPKTLEQSESCPSCICGASDPNTVVRGTLLIPCRTAMKGRFPLNGTYFQTNEVFADHESSVNPIEVPRLWLWNLWRRTLYCGSATSNIMRGASIEDVQKCFWEGFVCLRGFDRRTKAPKNLGFMFHDGRSKSQKRKQN